MLVIKFKVPLGADWVQVTNFVKWLKAMLESMPGSGAFRIADWHADE